MFLRLILLINSKYAALFHRAYLDGMSVNSITNRD